MSGCSDNYTSTSFTEVSLDRTRLIDGIKSYQSIEEFKIFLADSSFQWKESKDQPSPERKPPFNVHTITINNYSHLGITGELTVIFFNNRLMETDFYPYVVNRYIDTNTLYRAEGLKFDNGGESRLPPYTLVQVTTDHNGRQRIRWSDSRLVKEFSLWIKKYS
jgi:hypothetical protein